MASAVQQPPSPHLPALLQISDTTLTARISKPTLCNDLIELGKTVLSYSVTLLIVDKETIPNPALQVLGMRNHLLSPQLIADLASFYFSASGIPGGGIPPTDKEELVQTFDAYIGALHKEYGMDDTTAWVTGVFTDYVNSAYPAFSTPLPANGNGGHRTSAETSANSAPRAHTPPSLIQLNENLTQRKALNRLKWTEVNVAQDPRLSHVPMWRLDAVFECNDTINRIIGSAVDTKKQTAKWAASAQALDWLRRTQEIGPFSGE